VGRPVPVQVRPWAPSVINHEGFQYATGTLRVSFVAWRTIRRISDNSPHYRPTRSLGFPHTVNKDAGHVGYLITVKGVAIYHPGDTDYIPEMKGLKPDVALLPVSGTMVGRNRSVASLYLWTLSVKQPFPDNGK